MKSEYSEATPYIQENTFTIHLNKHKNKIEYNSIQQKELFLWMATASENAICEVMKRINPSPYKKLMGPEKSRLHALLVAADIQRRTDLNGVRLSVQSLSPMEQGRRPVGKPYTPKERTIGSITGRGGVASVVRV